MDKAFWQAVVEADFKVPNGHTVAQLTPELLGFLGSTDIDVRDPFGYMILAHWIVRDRHYAPDDLRRLRDQLIANLEQGIGENGTDSVFLRSFSMLMLSVIVYRDNQESFLSPDEVRALLDKSLWYFQAEGDLRGYLPDKGWAHTVAHTADAFKFLARNLHTTANDHRRILSAIADKMLLPVAHTYIYGEDERLVSALIDVLKRETLTLDDWSAWVERFTTWKGTWEEGDFVTTIHAPWYNTKNLLRSFYFRLELVSDLPSSSPGLKPSLLDAIRVFGQ